MLNSFNGKVFRFKNLPHVTNNRYKCLMFLRSWHLQKTRHSHSVAGLKVLKGLYQLRDCWIERETFPIASTAFLFPKLNANARLKLTNAVWYSCFFTAVYPKLMQVWKVGQLPRISIT